MYKNLKSHYCFFIQLCMFIFGLFANPLAASEWTNWTEDPADPIFNPGRAYYPSVIYDKNRFGNNSPYYKMWYQSATGIGLAYSEDGINNWLIQTVTGLPIEASHPVVIYNPAGFNDAPTKFYKIWYWTGTPGTTPDVIQYSTSIDGVNWDPPAPITQDTTFPLVNGDSTSYFYHLYGPGFVIYNPNAPNPPTEQEPYTFPYVMFYDTSSESPQPTTQFTIETIALAYSSDGIHWTRYGDKPVVIPPGSMTDAWDNQYVYRPSVIKASDGTFQMFYSGSNPAVTGSDGNTTAHGIGHASSNDGLTWVLDPDNPIFYIKPIPQQPVVPNWRTNRTYTPWVLFEDFCNANQCDSCVLKMWFTGANSTDRRAIGYATKPCPPTVTGLNPNSGPLAGGTTVTISGATFTGATSVKFGNVNASFIINSDTSITATSPPGLAIGPVDVTVTTPSGTSQITSADIFTYIISQPIISDLDPTIGTLEGGTPVTITGLNFSGATQVLFGSQPASSFTVNSDTSITAISPPGQSVGPIDVRVTTAEGTSPITSEDVFTYVDHEPAISDVHPNFGPLAGGTVVTITGMNFTGTTQVLFGSQPVGFTVNSDTSITVTSPPAQDVGPVDIRVTTPRGTSSLTEEDIFNYVDHGPAVLDVDPNMGPLVGGIPVTIIGMNFTGATAVFFGTQSAEFTVNSSTSITATVPHAQAAGTVDVTVVTPIGTSPITEVDHFTYFAPTLPTILAVNPDFGAEGGGNTVTIRGTNFTGATAVIFGSEPAQFSVDSDSQITAIAPPGTGTIDIRVTTPEGTSVITQEDEYQYLPAEPPLPPSHFIGVIKLRGSIFHPRFLLVATWDPSPSPDVILYRIYQQGKVVDEIPATAPFKFKTRVHLIHFKPNYKIAAVNAAGLESKRVKLKMKHRHHSSSSIED